MDLVLASGGDGTITACVAGVAGTGTPLGVLPCGTGNLLARNLGVPLDLNAAITVALTGNDRSLDVGEANGHTFVVMAGLGFDAVMLAGTSDLLKKHAGWLAYAVSGLRHLWDWPTRMIIKVDDEPPLDRTASGVIIGNVGTLQGNLQLLPDAVPDDGVLDVAVLTAVGAIGWLVLDFNVLRRHKTIQVDWLTCRELVIETRRARPWQIDGDVIGFGRRLVVRVRPANLLVRVPADPAA